MKDAMLAAFLTVSILGFAVFLWFVGSEFPSIIEWAAILLVPACVFGWIHESIKQSRELRKNPREMTSYDL